LGGGEVGYADEAGAGWTDEFLHGGPDGEVVEGCVSGGVSLGPVDEEEVEVG